MRAFQIGESVRGVQNGRLCVITKRWRDRGDRAYSYEAESATDGLRHVFGRGDLAPLSVDDIFLTDAAEKAREWTETRNRMIREARAKGLTLRAIAELTGLTHTAIAKIAATKRKAS